ncbi:MAG: formylglycine-generating enzyme family protein [Planctomycetes bacterium]|nr:formylglycine-generating enzyme family protein [Planctomycetota bacterium]
MVRLPGGVFAMGTNSGFAFEAPVHEIELSPFWIDEHEVTVGQYSVFVAATGHVTVAERLGWSGVFDFSNGEWKVVEGADWRHPVDPSLVAPDDQPVTQLAWEDAERYAAWASKRLPTEAEYEYAARGGSLGTLYAWGDELVPAGVHRTNAWQGHFPERDLGQDGFVGVAPVKSFPPNGYGLYDLTGNVWEWCADWYDPAYYLDSPRRDPRGPERGDDRVIRGGSFLCSENYCRGYRVAARNHTPHDSGLDHLGFRCARSDEAAR